MKKLTFLTLAIGTALVIQSCGGNGAKTSTEVADSANKAKVDSTKDSTKAGSTATATPPITVQEGDAKFAVEAGNGGMAEVALSKQALIKATDPKLKEFAAGMIADHGKANDELMALAKSKNISLPGTVSADKQKAADQLAKKTGADYDKAYADMMLDDHTKTVSLFEDEAKNAKDPDIKAFVDKTLPTLKAHLKHIQGIKDGMK